MDEILKLVIVDDHALYRLGERAVISEKLPTVKILAEYSSGQELLVGFKSGLVPDIILLDIVMPGINGIETAKKIKQDYPEIKIIMLSSEVAPEIINELLDIGVNGYLSKLAVKDDLADAIKSVSEGNLFYGQDIARIVYNTYISQSTQTPSSKKSFFSLKRNDNVSFSEREKKIIEFLCEGITTKEVAARLNVSKRTIDTHKSNIMQKLGFHSTVELVKYAIKEGMVTL